VASWQSLFIFIFQPEAGQPLAEIFILIFIALSYI
jgi:hypothetical protein